MVLAVLPGLLHVVRAGQPVPFLPDFDEVQAGPRAVERAERAERAELVEHGVVAFVPHPGLLPGPPGRASR